MRSRQMVILFAVAGLSLAAPFARAQEDEQGRAQNRRVELVEQSAAISARRSLAA